MKCLGSNETLWPIDLSDRGEVGVAGDARLLFLHSVVLLGSTASDQGLLGL